MIAFIKNLATSILDSILTNMFWLIGNQDTLLLLDEEALKEAAAKTPFFICESCDVAPRIGHGLLAIKTHKREHISRHFSVDHTKRDKAGQKQKSA